MVYSMEPMITDEMAFVEGPASYALLQGAAMDLEMHPDNEAVQARARALYLRSQAGRVSYESWMDSPEEGGPFLPLLEAQATIAATLGIE